MELQDYIDSIKFQLTGGILESEIDDKGYRKIIEMALRELNHYYNQTRLINLPCNESCIDYSDHPEINTVVNLYRPKGVGGDTSVSDSTVDPVLMSQLQMYNFGAGNYSTDWIYRYGNYSLIQQISNTISTDLYFKQDKSEKKLYVNIPMGAPGTLAVEYIPTLNDVSDVVGDYWTDTLLRLSIAYAKIALGRIRTRFTQQGALWSSDGDTILAEGNTELTALREALRSANDYVLPVD